MNPQLLSGSALIRAR